ncbi:MAG TPA: Rieske (2Fe-2S) protein [Gammaproteobacteria bacterium]|nr:Rieske (2Fe-2S) protein [Gammaproteobacteria bacterium]
MTRYLDICGVDDLAEPGAKEFEIENSRGQKWYGFLVKKDGAFHAYANACPHTGAMLNWGPDRFLTRAGDRIMCGVHGALFEIDTGLCVAGPCQGQSLRDLEVRVEDGRVQVLQPE